MRKATGDWLLASWPEKEQIVAELWPACQLTSGQLADRQNISDAPTGLMSTFSREGM